MKAYSGYDTKVNGLLEDELRRSKHANTLYVADYYFAVNDGQALIFYYNPQFYWDKILIEQVQDYVWENLQAECAVFHHVDPDDKTQGQFMANEQPHEAFFPTAPKIGNHYSFLGNRVVSHHGNYYFLGDFGGCSKIAVKDLNLKTIFFLFDIAVETKTPNFIESIHELSCFKKPD
jgi:hypothetical protein